jgi:hypothetical protein
MKEHHTTSCYVVQYTGHTALAEQQHTLCLQQDELVIDSTNMLLAMLNSAAASACFDEASITRA